jgi:hypothetical protein
MPRSGSHGGPERPLIDRLAIERCRSNVVADFKRTFELGRQADLPQFEATRGVSDRNAEAIKNAD